MKNNAPIPLIVILITLILQYACTPKELTDEQIKELANEICQNSLILDSHIDWPESVLLNPRNIAEENEVGEFDYPRAKKGGLNAVMSVLYINSEYNLEDGRSIFDSIYNIVTSYPLNYPKRFAQPVNPEETRSNFKNKLFSLPLCLENASVIGDDLDYISHLKKLGITYITLNHNKSNQISDANMDTNRPWNGLSPFGIEVVDEMNRLGLIIDISHSSDSTVKQILRKSKAPIVATHSSCRHFTPGFERNLSDELIKEIANKDGIIMVAFGSMFIDSACSKNINHALHYFDSAQVRYDSEEAMLFIQEFIKDHKIIAEAFQIVDHIDHIVDIVGLDHVGLGSDFDGVGPSMPSGMPDVSAYHVIVEEMLRRGYKKEEIEKILGENFLRVWQNVLDVARDL